MNELVEQLRVAALALQARFDMPREPHRGLKSVDLLTASAGLYVAAGLIESGAWSSARGWLMLVNAREVFA